MSERKNSLLLKTEFLEALGMFHGAWSDMDLSVDYAIGQFLEIPPEQTHLLTSGMMFGRKATLLAGLIARSDHPNKDKLMEALNVARGEIRRDWLTHAYLNATPTTVTFVHRNASGEYKVNQLSFTMEEFLDHCLKLARAGHQFQSAIGLTESRQDAFVNAAKKAENKSKARSADH
jgi:hypothetical protein